uniref:Zinc metalloproteinase n=1 Tax=Strongyloides papillosus TaxID=174720 RepID=A0A0N5BB48_STREA
MPSHRCWIWRCKSKFLFNLYFIFLIQLTRLRIQQETREELSEGSKKSFDEHQKAMEQLVKLSSQIHGVKPPKDDDKFEMGPMENPSMYQGDMILNKHQAEYLLDEAKMRLEAKQANKTGPEAEKEIVDKLKKNRAFRKNAPTKWQFPIPYYIDGQVQHAVVDNAIKGIEKETCIRFQKSQSFKGRHGLRIFPGRGCFSNIGPISADNVQDVSIGQGCEWNGIVQHEVSHALGLFHEQSRPDRDDYININLNNVAPNQRHNYDKTTLAESESFGIPYDYGSTMQYDKKSFSANGQLTMIPKNPLYLNTIGQFDKLQFNDVKLLNTVYCQDKCKGGIKCSNGGYEDPNRCGQCKCPFMLGGPTCSEVAKNPPNCGQGNSLEATPQEKTLDIKGGKRCVYEIKGNGKKVQIRIELGIFYPSERF